MFLNRRCVISFNLFVDGNSVKQTLKVTFGKRIAFRVKSEIEKKVFLLKLFPNMGTVEPLLEEEPLVLPLPCY